MMEIIFIRHGLAGIANPLEKGDQPREILPSPALHCRQAADFVALEFGFKGQKNSISFMPSLCHACSESAKATWKEKMASWLWTQAQLSSIT